MSDAFIMRRGGGAALNFQIVGGTTQPENPKENTIWINTDVEITDWAISRTAPSNPIKGMVHIVTHNNMTTKVGVLKKNTLDVYPSSCYQYVGGIWIAKTAKTYTNGSWVPWKLYVYNRGNQCSAVTNGWYALSYTNGVSFDSDKINLWGNSGVSAQARTKGLVDVSGFTTMTVIGYSNSSHESTIALQNCGLINRSGSNVASWGASGVGHFTKKIDIKSINGYHYVHLGTGTANGCKGYVYEIYFE